MFAALFFERDPLQTADLGAGFLFWLRYVGGVAALGIVLVGLAKVFARVPPRRNLAIILQLFGGLFLALIAAIFLAPGDRPARSGDVVWSLLALGSSMGLIGVLFVNLLREAKVEGLRGWLFVLGLGGAVCFYGMFLLALAPFYFHNVKAFWEGQQYNPELSESFQRSMLVCQILGGAFGLFGAGIDFVLDLVLMRWRRIWAITLLTCNEVRRNRVLWAYLGLAVVFLFATWFIPAKPENQVYIYVQVVFIAVSGLLLLTTSLTAAFGLHNDIKNQTIHTVLTKPVEHYEVVLGRFLGYTLMMSAALFVMLSFSLIYLLRGVHPTAQAESLKARVPVYGSLEYVGTNNPKGENVGNEWEYRGYISGPMPGSQPQYAIWTLDNLLRDLASRDQVPCEFTFSIYRTTTGDIRGGVLTALEIRSCAGRPAARMNTPSGSNPGTSTIWRRCMATSPNRRSASPMASPSGFKYPRACSRPRWPAPGTSRPSWTRPARSWTRSSRNCRPRKAPTTRGRSPSWRRQFRVCSRMNG